MNSELYLANIEYTIKVQEQRNTLLNALKIAAKIIHDDLGTEIPEIEDALAKVEGSAV